MAEGLGKEFDQRNVRLIGEIPLKLFRVGIAMAAFKMRNEFLKQNGPIQMAILSESGRLKGERSKEADST